MSSTPREVLWLFPFVVLVAVTVPPATVTADTRPTAYPVADRLAA